VIETYELRRTFKSGRGEVEAVAGVDLKVSEGEIFGFLGPNGAGKTTTLRMLVTLLPPSGGEARVAGKDLRTEQAAVRRRIGYVPQSGSTDPQLTARRELVMQGRVYGMSKGEARRRAAEVLDTLSLSGAADRNCGTYSGGQRRRLDIGLGLVHRPVLLFMDEPTTGLDPQSRAHLWDEIRRLRDAGTTVFLTTHYLDEADALCDRVAIIDHGRIVAEGTPDALKRQVSGDQVTIGVGGDPEPVRELLASEPYVREATTAPSTEPGIEGGTVRLYVTDGDTALPKLLRHLDGHGVTPQTMTLARPSLDDVFLRQTGRSLRDDAA
jgi:ABC-2 type transport system ATP-binding protein